MTQQSCNNPTIFAYLGQTLDFLVDSPGNGLWIKQKPTLGDGEANPIWANAMENNGTESGRLRVRFNQPGEYVYISRTDGRLQGKIVVRPDARRWPADPNQTYRVTTGPSIAKDSDAYFVLPLDTDFTDIKNGYVFEALDPEELYIQDTITKFGGGAAKFDTPGAISGTVLRGTGGANSATGYNLIDTTKSFTIEFWVMFLTYNEDDPNWDPESPDYRGGEPYVTLFSLAGVDLRPDSNCSGTDNCFHKPEVFSLQYFSKIRDPDELPYMKVKLWNNKVTSQVPPDLEYNFELPRILESGEILEDVLAVDVWHHLAFTYDMEEQGLTFYCDGLRRGQVFDSSIPTGIDPCNANYHMGIGGYANSLGDIPPEVDTSGGILGDESLNGFMDDVRILKGIRYRDSTYNVPEGPFPIE